eukprot:5605835-Amphidinium_carterae.1
MLTLGKSNRPIHPTLCRHALRSTPFRPPTDFSYRKLQEVTQRWMRAQFMRSTNNTKPRHQHLLLIIMTTAII